jgi:hypothetical protein
MTDWKDKRDKEKRRQIQEEIIRAHNYEIMTYIKMMILLFIMKHLNSLSLSHTHAHTPWDVATETMIKNSEKIPKCNISAHQHNTVICLQNMHIKLIHRFQNECLKTSR